MGALNELLKDIPGYKIMESHFRIGSKIHISDFYYAKRFFQNSFFASRFAYLLTKEIIKDLDIDPRIDHDMKGLPGFVTLDHLRKEGVSLFGYGVYSELLLSLTEKFMKAHGGFDDDKISHNIIEDESCLEPIKDSRPHKNIIIVVPIASTFSTSIKMERELKRKYDVNVLGVHYNLLHVFSKPLTHKPTPIEKEFGWTNKIWDKRQIHVEAFYARPDRNRRIQKYFIQLPSEWQDIKECMNCYKKNEKGEELLLDEKPLFETDRTEVNPAMIFEIPKANPIETKFPPPTYDLKPSMIGYGHQVRNSGHFLYTIDTEEFLNTNESKVRKWLETLIDKTDITKDLGELDNVLIVSSCHYSNTGFLNLVNQVLFSSSANIIHYDPTHDYIQNFDMIYGQEVYMAEKIVFVDDSLKSGRTFGKIEEFIRHTIHLRNQRKGTTKDTRIHSCIFLVNKSQPYTYERIKASLSKPSQFFSFANLNLFTSLSPDEDSPLLLEESKYKKLYNLSMLDHLRNHYRWQKNKLSIKRPQHIDENSDERHLKMLEATHRLYDYFTKVDTIPDEIGFDDFMTELKAKTRFAGKYNPMKEQESRFSMLEGSVLKVLTHFPFTQYEPIRKITFHWVLDLLCKEMEDVIDHIDSGKFSYKEFRDLKFLIRRATLLNSNVLISHKAFQLLRALYKPGGLLKIKGDIERWKEEKPVANTTGLLTEVSKAYEERSQKSLAEKKGYALRSVEKFQVFCCAQIKELLWLNETRSIRLEQIISDENTSSDPGYQRLVTMIRVENAVIIQQFLEFLDTIPAWKEIRVSGHVDQLSKDKEKIQQILGRQQVKGHHSYKTLCQYFNETKQPVNPPDNDAFLFFLCARVYVMHEQAMQSSERKLEEKTHYLFEIMNRVVTYTDTSNDIVSTVGAFLIIKDANGFPHIVYDYSKSNFSQLDKGSWSSPECSLLTQMLGLKKNPLPGMAAEPAEIQEEIAVQNNDLLDEDEKEGPAEQDDIIDALDYFEQETILELARENGSWLNKHAENYSERPVSLSPEFLDQAINRFIPLRMSNREGGKERTKGLAGFYFYAKKNDASDLVRLQYLLLLQPTIADFIEHNHRNNLFHEWLLTENQKRMMLLTGHSRETLERLAQENSDFQGYARHLDYLQTLVQLNESIRNIGGRSELKSKLSPYFHLDERTEITEKYAEILRKMGDYLFKTDIIENNDEANVTIAARPPFKFITNRSLIDLICFELFINAKKNRWHFFEKDKPCGITQNQVIIDMYVEEEGDKRKLVIAISNTGPNARKSDDVNKVIRNPFYAIKPDRLTSGTAMIQSLIRDVFGGEFIPSSKALTNEHSPHLFTVTLKIPES